MIIFLLYNEDQILVSYSKYLVTIVLAIHLVLAYLLPLHNQPWNIAMGISFLSRIRFNGYKD